MTRFLSWRDRAACIGQPADLFFPPKPRTAANYKVARAICERCPVRQECSDLVMELETVDDRWGMFGGLTPSERRRARAAYRKGDDVSLMSREPTQYGRGHG